MNHSPGGVVFGTFVYPRFTVLESVFTDMPRSPTVTADGTVEAIRSSETPFASTGDLADYFDVTRQAVREQRERLRGDPRIKVGQIGNSTVFYLADDHPIGSKVAEGQENEGRSGEDTAKELGGIDGAADSSRGVGEIEGEDPINPKTEAIENTLSEGTSSKIRNVSLLAGGIVGGSIFGLLSWLVGGGLIVLSLILVLTVASAWVFAVVFHFTIIYVWGSSNGGSTEVVKQ